MMLKFMSVVVLVLALHFTTAAQFNDTTLHRLSVNFGGNLSKSSTDKNYLLNNVLKYGFKRRKSELNFNTGWLYGENNDGLTNNDVFSSLDFNIYKDTTSKLNYWGLAGYTSSYSLKINNQFQAGLGAAYKFVDNKAVYFRVSDGFLFEQTDLMINDTVRDRYSTIRNSLRLQLKLFPAQRVSFEATGFWQPSMKNFNDYITTTQAALNIKLVKWLSLTTRFNYNRMSKTNKENILFSYGILIDQYF